MILICKILVTQEFFVQSLVEIGQAVLKKIFSTMYFSLFCYYLPLEIKVCLHLNNHESPSPTDALCQVWLELDHGFRRRRFLKFVKVFSLFRNYLPFTQGCFVPSIIDIDPLVLEKKILKILQCIFAIS